MITVGQPRTSWTLNQMYSLFKKIGIRQGLKQELVPFVASLFVAELFFKWGSFSLELVGFLATWWILGMAFSLALRAMTED